MRRRLSLLLFVLLSPLAAATPAPDDLLATVSARLARSPVVRADVLQLKTLAILSKPIRSEGRLLFSREHGLYWALQQPFPSETLVTPRALVQVTDGQRRVLATAQQPALAAITAVFFPVLAGDLVALQDAFELSLQGTTQQWALTLVPRQEPLNRFISSLLLSGGDDLERIRITDRNGDVTDMQFSGVRREPASLDAEEQAHFALE